MPTEGPLVDGFGRVHTDLRMSLTDRCNFRCRYCLPEEGASWLPTGDILSFAEIVRVASVARELGVASVRLTGGEPLVRPGVAELVRMVAEVGFEDLSLTTNGVRLARLADDLARAGLGRVNVSCDSLRRDRFRQITGRDALPQVLAAMDAAEAAGLAPVKVNVVVMVGVNDDEVLDFAAYARRSGRTVRFIEFMPLDAAHAWERPLVLSGEEIVRRIDACWPLVPVGGREGDAAPADRFRFLDGRGEIGVIPTVTNPFCGGCNRLRITADGAVRNCLFAPREWSLRDAMRSGCSDRDLSLLLREAVWQKLPGHGIDEPGFLRPARTMSQIGG
jgi:cyclic pyranopterin phosphate synthase